ncbi:ribosome recycling factor [Sphaeroforma arctica JP610]|uniref:Ribosome recycling factor n=1 Tax=Sphaeroforma arctica JP610 TaxID=667725 RepID=A0A0L0FMJ9_9EUKA|nr:ribosome recycling factor [Sphaeroforma arctica JP610]KNC77980.1 ribosome recycling factor [Sphaeroforma arctica JP610]|eukprot:XP_014151882.1 ribosome recycling factor [Sphaeroforma arctica JP610]
MISCYDPSSAPHVVSAILEADMGLNPDIADEGMIKVPIPKTTKETRQTLIKKCKEIAERAKVNLRGARGKGMDQVKHANLPKDEARAAEKRVQKEHDSIHKELDAIAHKKIDSLA